MDKLKRLVRKPKHAPSGAYLAPESLEASQMAQSKLAFMDDLPGMFALAAPDRGTWTAEQLRERASQATLVEGGRKAGKSRVAYYSPNLELLLFARDFFISAINQKTWVIMVTVCMLYLVLSFLWSIPYYLIMRYQPGCIYGATHYVEIWVYAFITMTTIGYGNTGPQACWSASVVISIQGIFSLLLEAVIIGIIFARVSHPKQRSRSIFISDTAIIARRDGILKFMFRVADVRKTQVVDPKIKAYLYTWGDGRITAEGERVPVRVEALDIGYIDGMLILPLTIEHTIDELSPLCGHTLDSLVAMSAELVITFEGTTEFGNPFMARRSYTPTDICWGYQFVDIIVRPHPPDTRYRIDLDRFHNVVPQPGLPPLAPSALSRLVVNRAKRTVPYPLLGDNTLVLSDTMCVHEDDQGRLCLTVRVADTYPNQVIEITAKMHLYRWLPPGSDPSFECCMLECGYKTGEDRLYLRLPTELTHVIDEDSPLAAWLQGPQGRAADADAEIVISGYLFSTGFNMLRQRTYSVLNHVKMGYRFVPIVKHPELQADKKPLVRWGKFHDIAPVDDRHLGTALSSPGRPSEPDDPGSMGTSRPGGGPGSGASPAGTPVRQASLAQSPSLHVQDSLADDFTVSPLDLARYAAMVNTGDNTILPTQGPAHQQFPPIPDFNTILEEAKDDPETQHTLRMLPHIARYALSTTDATDTLHAFGTNHASMKALRAHAMDDDDDDDSGEEETVQALGNDLERYSEIMADDNPREDPDAGGLPVNEVEHQVTASSDSTQSTDQEEAALLQGTAPGGLEETTAASGEEGPPPPLLAPADSPEPGSSRADSPEPGSPMATVPDEEEVEPAVAPASQPRILRAMSQHSLSMLASARASLTAGGGVAHEEAGPPPPRPRSRQTPSHESEDDSVVNEEQNERPIHLNIGSSWAQSRALTNLFAEPASPPPAQENPARPSAGDGSDTPTPPRSA